MCRTVVNVTGDGAVSSIIAASENELEQGLRFPRTYFRFAAILLALFCSENGELRFAQDEACCVHLNYSIEKVLRLIGESPKRLQIRSRSERIAFIELAYSKDEECMACLLEWGKRLEFAAAKKDRSQLLCC